MGHMYTVTAPPRVVSGLSGGCRLSMTVIGVSRLARWPLGVGECLTYLPLRSDTKLKLPYYAKNPIAGTVVHSSSELQLSTRALVATSTRTLRGKNADPTMLDGTSSYCTY